MRNGDGHFPEESINGKVEKKLLYYSEQQRQMNAGANNQKSPA